MQRWWAGSCAAVLLLAVAPAAQQDKIVSKDGKERTARIQSEDFDGLKIAVEGGSTTIAWKDVDSIRYGSAAKYHEALDAFYSEGPAKALPLLDALAADDKLRAVLRHGVLYHLGLAQKQQGNADAAIANFEKLLKDYPRSRYLISVGTNLLALYVAKGDPGAASKSLDSILSAARSSGGAGSMQLGIDFLRGRLLEEQKKYPEAERTFESVASSQADAALALSAKLALARCAQRAGRASDAQRRYREIVVLDAPNEVLAGAWNGLGDLALAEASTKRDAEGVRYALFSYLRGAILYLPGRGESSEEYERALAGSARAFKAVGELETDGTRKKLFLGRAQERRQQLAAEFPRSRFLEGL